jgi:hypothetical protein
MSARDDADVELSQHRPIICRPMPRYFDSSCRELFSVQRKSHFHDYELIAIATAHPQHHTHFHLHYRQVCLHPSMEELRKERLIGGGQMG